jgi:hypothetical protein
MPRPAAAAASPKSGSSPGSTGAESDARKPKSRKAKAGKAKAVLERPATPPGWLTSDENEIGLRRWRGRTEILSIAALEPAHPCYGNFRAESASGGSYEVEVRNLDAPANSCGCIDYQVNGLGTCKHIEGTLAALARTKAFRATSAAGNRRVEVYLDRRNGAVPTVTWPLDADHDLEPVRAWLAPYLAPDWTLTRAPETIEALLAAFETAPPAVRVAMRVSRHFTPWLDRARRMRHRIEARAAFEADVAAGRATLDILKHQLLPYQRDGVLHLAFGERALLADEMGLGKTIQAISACMLLAETRQIERVLVVCPASLKAEWEEQIARFCDRTTRLVFGARHQRLAAYKDPAFFTIVNYEQVLGDAEFLNGVLRPDVVVLDEAQRIKNWQTKTARRVKSLRSRYAFVLTGTPLENRIDELYSILQFLDPEILGPLFRFNRDFYQLDDRGRPVNYQNLAELRERVKPLLLRRRKAEVETQLPGRTVKTYFVPMAEEQKERYLDYYKPAQQLIAKSQRRPLLQVEFDRLQMLLACMRMVCDTPAILDSTCRISPKLEEMEGVLGDLLAEPDRKVIVFSEWERMLTLVRELAGEMGVEVAWHTGSLPQDRRRAEINRFKNDPACRLFLSTDSGSVGLNLQVASAVVNVDLPWNPAKLEQRIARAWRKNQTRSVAVINLVTEGSIEHNILHLLGQKQALADGVIDGAGDLAKLQMPSGRAAFIERMKAIMTPRPAPRIIPPEETATADLLARHGGKALLVEARRGADGTPKLFAVLDLDSVALAAEAARLATEAVALPIEVIDRATWLVMRRLAATGLLHFTHEPRVLHRSPAFAEASAGAVGAGTGVGTGAAGAGAGAGEEASAWEDSVAAAEARRIRGLVAQLTEEAGRTLRKAKLLASGGFPEDAPALLLVALQRAAAARLTERGELPAGAPASDADIRRLVEREGLPADALDVLDASQPSAARPVADETDALLDAAERFVAAIAARDGAGALAEMAGAAVGMAPPARTANVEPRRAA